MNEINEIIKTEIENTPFTVITNGETKQSFIVFANQRVSPIDFDSIEEAEEYINEKPWELILIASNIYNDKVNEIKQQIQHNSISIEQEEGGE